MHETANALHSASLRLLRLAARADTGMDLDGPRASLLSVLVFSGPQPMSHLAQLERVTPAAITKLVIALEGLGLARRARDTTVDRRVIRVEATAKGRAVLQEGRAERIRMIANLLANTPARERATLRRAADIVAKRLLGR